MVETNDGKEHWCKTGEHLWRCRNVHCSADRVAECPAHHGRGGLPSSADLDAVARDQAIGKVTFERNK